MCQCVDTDISPCAYPRLRLLNSDVVKYLPGNYLLSDYRRVDPAKRATAVNPPSPHPTSITQIRIECNRVVASYTKILTKVRKGCRSGQNAKCGPRLMIQPCQG